MTQVNLRNSVQLEETARLMKQGMTIEERGFEITENLSIFLYP